MIVLTCSALFPIAARRCDVASRDLYLSKPLNRATLAAPMMPVAAAVNAVPNARPANAPAFDAAPSYPDRADENRPATGNDDAIDELNDEPNPRPADTPFAANPSTMREPAAFVARSTSRDNCSPALRPAAAASLVTFSPIARPAAEPPRAPAASISRSMFFAATAAARSSRREIMLT
ncbi:hypothetical protein M184_gp69 [Mycobacterium phage WIVsmall]|uniref:hypothetical protein n=1 Tax=Mycobacterium phage WIVsmall TaxID=1327036 RepID=UPI00032B5CF0|nr:hypothetical protein M184_gp69 [Mycobacterium phage WIVsmall]AGK88199.1 hypothetical protein WIVsmall_69 [Mycobacterium phage WIVsmall]